MIRVALLALALSISPAAAATLRPTVPKPVGTEQCVKRDVALPMVVKWAIQWKGQISVLEGEDAKAFLRAYYEYADAVPRVASAIIVIETPASARVLWYTKGYLCGHTDMHPSAVKNMLWQARRTV